MSHQDPILFLSNRHFDGNLRALAYIQIHKYCVKDAAIQQNYNIKHAKYRFHY